MIKYNFLTAYKIAQKFLKFRETEIEKHKFHQHKNPFSIYDVDISKILVSKKVYLGNKGFKYFIGYNNSKKTRPLCVILPKMSEYRRYFDKTKYILSW